MIVTYIRSSSYNNYDFCQMQYFLTYVLGWRSDSGKKAEMGTMAHKVMEVLAGLKKFQQDNPRKKYLVVNDDKCGKIREHQDKLHTGEFVDRLTEKAISDYAKDSRHKFYRKERAEIRQTDIPIEEEWAKFDFVDAHGKQQTGQLAIKGTIDLVTLVNEETIEVVDWKSGRRLDWATGEEKTYEKMWGDPQLLLYFYAIASVLTRVTKKDF